MSSSAPNSSSDKTISNAVKSIVSSPPKIALAMLCVLLVWLFIVGDYKSSEDEAPSDDTQVANSVNHVKVKTSSAEDWNENVVLQGQLLPWRRVSLKSEVSGRVIAVHKNQGDYVNDGEIILEISDEGRSSQLKQAQADVEFNRLELESAKELKKSKFVSASDLSRFKSALAEAEAKLEKAQLAYDYGQPKAAFSGYIDRRHIELGDQIRAGDALFDLVQIDKLRVTAFVSQQEVAKLSQGQIISLTLLNGTELDGKLTFISAAADENTRSYYIEVSVDAKNQTRIAGASVTLTIPTATQASHTINPSLLSLDTNGKPGIYAVDNENTVRYFPVEVLPSAQAL